MRRLIVLTGILAAVFLPGCIVLTVDFYDPVPDPLADQYVTGKAVAGRTVTLSSGKEVELSGIDVQSLDAEQRAALEAALTKEVVGRKDLLVLDEHDKTATVVAPRRMMMSWERFPAIVLFPHHIKVTPERVDVGGQLIGEGLAKARESEITDPARLKIYLAMQEKAQRQHIGVWKTDVERLCDAAGKGDLAMVRELLAKGAGVDAVGYTDRDAITPLVAAAGHGREECLGYLLANGADVNSRKGFNRTALLAATASGSAKVVSILIAAGADINARSWFSPLELAVMGGHLEVVRTLLEAGAKTGCFGHDTALQIAARQGELDIAKLLVEHGANADERDRDGNTALMFAVGNGRVDMVEFLLASGADPNARDTYHNTVLIRARQSYNPKVIAIIEQASAHK